MKRIVSFVGWSNECDGRVKRTVGVRENKMVGCVGLSVG